MKKQILTLLLLTATWSLPACSASQNAATPPAEEISAEQNADLAQIAALLGMKDEDTAELFGGGRENWTADKKLYIGRIYSAPFDGQDIFMYTSCGPDSIVDAVSVHLFNGETALSDETVQYCVEQITKFVGSSPAYDDVSSEAGSKRWKWAADGYFISLYQLQDQLTLTMNPAVGELK